MLKGLFKRFKRPKRLKYKSCDYLAQIELIRSKGLKITSLEVEYDQQSGQYWAIKVKEDKKKKSGD